MAVKVLFFGDIGIDDAVALIYSHLNEGVELVGVVADYGNVPREAAVSSVHYLLELFDLKGKIRVIGGAETPMTGEQPTFYPEIHGKYGLGPIIPGVYEGVIENFFEIVRLIEKYENELVIVNVGRLTSLATMFILYQSLMEKVKAYYIMGGAFWVPGNVTAVSEANIYADPIAADIVFTYATNVTIFPLNVTDHAIITPAMSDYIAYKGKAKILKTLVDYYYEFYKNRDPGIIGSPIHDLLPVMAAVDDTMFSFRMLPVKVVTEREGAHRGQTIADIRSYVTLPSSEKRHRIAFQFDYFSFYKNFMCTMTGEDF
ncbi:nucleoside hydrolase [Thalassobacillus devorans]|uniref:nucleoside hydrolase n=1 Tax=Thalassobacillus devorans TaxID=279813 RepID=UPI00048BC9FB|nr:nucleoside hydrolase [Thalassobacillus devorans]